MQPQTEQTASCLAATGRTQQQQRRAERAAEREARRHTGQNALFYIKQHAKQVRAGVYTEVSFVPSESKACPGDDSALGAALRQRLQEQKEQNETQSKPCVPDTEVGSQCLTPPLEPVCPKPEYAPCSPSYTPWSPAYAPLESYDEQ